MKMIRIVVADDELLLREAIVTLLGLDEDLDIVGTASNGREALDVIARFQPDIAILDLEMPMLDGIEVSSRIPTTSPGTAVVLLTRYARPAVLRRALDAGIIAFVTKATSIKELPHILRTVHGGGRYVDGTVAAAALSERNCPLTEREIEVLRESVDGRTVRDIAERTHLAPGTVRNYLSSAMIKLGAETRVSAARIAWDEGWI